MGLRRFGGPGMHGIGGVPLSSMGGGALGGYFSKVLATGPIAYWPLWEASGTVAQCLVNVAQNGTYSADVSGWPPGTGIGDGNTAPWFDGATRYVNIWSAVFSAAFNGAEGSAAIWFKVNGAATWLDATVRNCYRVLADSNNYAEIARSTTNHRVSSVYRAGGVFLSMGNTYGTGPTIWVHAAHTWSASANQYKFFLDGAQIGATLGGLGVWAGAPANGTTNIGASAVVPATVWHGWLAHMGVWNRALSPTEIAALAVI